MEEHRIEKLAQEFLNAVDALKTDKAHALFKELFLNMDNKIKKNSFDEAVFTIQEAIGRNLEKKTGSGIQGYYLPKTPSAENKIIEQMRENLLPLHAQRLLILNNTFGY